jgi:hypothetical protein
MIRRDNELQYHAGSVAALCGRSPAQAGSRCQEERRST